MHSKRQHVAGNSFIRPSILSGVIALMDGSGVIMIMHALIMQPIQGDAPNPIRRVYISNSFHDRIPESLNSVIPLFDVRGIEVVGISYTVQTEERDSIRLLFGEKIACHSSFIRESVEILEKVEFTGVGGVDVVDQVRVECTP
jgi:hypothetical protein